MRQKEQSHTEHGQLAGTVKKRLLCHLSFVHQGAWWGLMAGLATGVGRYAMRVYYSGPSCGSGDPDERPSVYKDVHFLHFAIILAAVTMVVTVSVSFLTAPRKESQVNHKLFSTFLGSTQKASQTSTFVSLCSVQNKKRIVKRAQDLWQC